MLARTYSATLIGVNAIEVIIESTEVTGLGFRVTVVGLPDTAVKESKERVLAAIRNSGFFSPSSGYLTINLSPADLKKEGPGFDLPIALSIVAGRERLTPEMLEECCMVGELALDGELRPVRGILAVALEARAKGRKRLLVPKRSAVEASVVQGIEIIGVESLRQTVFYLRGDIAIAPEPCRATEYFAAHAHYGIDFSEVKGQQDAKRAIEVAVAGGHNVFMLWLNSPSIHSPTQVAHYKAFAVDCRQDGELDFLDEGTKRGELGHNQQTLKCLTLFSSPTLKKQHIPRQPGAPSLLALNDFRYEGRMRDDLSSVNCAFHKRLDESSPLLLLSK